LSFSLAPEKAEALLPSPPPPVENVVVEQLELKANNLERERLNLLLQAKLIGIATEDDLADIEFLSKKLRKS